MARVLWMTISDQFGELEHSCLLSEMDTDILQECLDDECIVSLFEVEESDTLELEESREHPTRWLMANASEVCVGDYV